MWKMSLKKIVINLLNNYLVYYLKKKQVEIVSWRDDSTPPLKLRNSHFKQKEKKKTL